uniref:Uncharacterized protein n=1 Tax=Anguilla anguilla TaxID=7936 RepID=A0A0E9U171_ANGAN
MNHLTGIVLLGNPTASP